ncbi:MAG: hypothetical protein NT062_05240, partial [Proteobacteria bacterium]|nr:hypothetical protein [Pseudomonadota bacterium]
MSHVMIGVGLGMLVACGQAPALDTRGYHVVASFPATANPELDLLFVIDDSNSTLHLQGNLGLAFSTFVAALPELPNLHVGVVTSDVGTSTHGGIADPVGGGGAGSCAGVGKNGLLQKGLVGDALTGVFVDTTATNYTQDLATTVGEMMMVGAQGCGFEQPLEALQRVLDPATNPGFLRPAANLAIVIIQDEDDCSLEDPAILGPETAALGPLQSFRCTQFGVTCDEDLTSVGDKHGCHAREDSPYVARVSDYVTTVAAVKAAPQQLVVAGIAAGAAPVAVEIVSSGSVGHLAVAHQCEWTIDTGLAVADPAVRLHAFLDGFPLSMSENVCENDYAPAMLALARRVASIGGSTSDACTFTALAGAPHL